MVWFLLGGESGLGSFEGLVVRGHVFSFSLAIRELGWEVRMFMRFPWKV